MIVIAIMDAALNWIQAIVLVITFIISIIVHRRVKKAEKGIEEIKQNGNHASL